MDLTLMNGNKIVKVNFWPSTGKIEFISEGNVVEIDYNASEELANWLNTI